MRRAKLAVAFAAVLALTHAQTVRAQPIRTWGGQPRPTPDRPGPDADVSRASLAPPPTMGTPVDAPPTPSPRRRRGPPAAEAANTCRRSSARRGRWASVHARGHRGARQHDDAVARRPSLRAVSRRRHARRRRPGARAHALPPARDRLLPRRAALAAARDAARVRDPRRRRRRAKHDRRQRRVARARDRREPERHARPLTAYGGARGHRDEPRRERASPSAARSPSPTSSSASARASPIPQFLGTCWIAEAELLYNHARDFFGNKDVLVDDPTQQATRTTPSCSTRASAGASARGTTSASRRRSSSTTGSRRSTRRCRSRRAITAGTTSSPSTSHPPRRARSSRRSARTSSTTRATSRSCRRAGHRVVRRARRRR